MDKQEVQLNEFERLEDMGFDGLKIVQDTRLYRFTSDSVLLSKFARAKSGEMIADFCSGSGIVAFHFFALNKEKLKNAQFTLFEMQENLANLSKKTARYNGFENFEFEIGRLQETAHDKKYHEFFSLVLCNPPYENGGFENAKQEIAVCRKEITICLEDICFAAGKVLKYGGRFALLHRADRLAEVCYTLKKYQLEVKKIQFVGGRVKTNPYLVMIEAVKGGKPNCEILPTILND